MQPETRYAKSGEVHVAYQLFGDGPINIVIVPGFVSHVENIWTHPVFARWLNRMGRFARVVIFDKRGTGLSDRVGGLPGVDDRMDDVRAVMDAAGFERAALLGISEGGTLTVLFAGTHPDRCQALILYGSFAKFSSWVPTKEDLEKFFNYIRSKWGSGKSMANFAPSMENDAAFRQWFGRFERLGASPGDAIKLMQMNSQIDISEILPSIHTPTLVIHRTGDRIVDVEAGRILAERIPGARYVELPGDDHIPQVGENAELIVDHIEEFLTGSKPMDNIERVLASVLFTDIVGSTARAEEMGDRRWHDLLDAHNNAARQEFSRFRGNEVKSLGDGFLTTFDGPARAIHCAVAVREAMKPLGIEIRIGVHIGEVEFSADDVYGIAVHIASRVAAFAGAGEILTSRTIKDLVAGSGINFKERGRKQFAGLQEPMEIYSVIQ